MINEQKVKCFQCLAETLNFTETGKILFISQQAVSRHISSLEMDMGVRLFERTRNSVVLTEAGVQFYQFFRETGARYHALLAELDPLNALQTKNIRIGYQNWVEFGPALGTAMAALREATPDLHLLGERHSPFALITLLQSAALDMVLVLERFLPQSSELRRVRLMTAPMQFVIARRDPLCTQYAGDYRIFQSKPLLIDAFEGENYTATVKRAKTELAPYKFEPCDIIVLPNRDSLYIEAELGRGVFLSSSMAQNAHNSTLARYDTDVQEGLLCVWRASASTQIIEQYARQLKQEYAKLSSQFLETGRWL